MDTINVFFDDLRFEKQQEIKEIIELLKDGTIMNSILNNRVPIATFNFKEVLKND